jgi:hypothetical protein
VILKLKFFDSLAPIVAKVEKFLPPHPAAEEVAVPVKPRALTVVPAAFAELVKLGAVLLAGITQDPNVSAKTEEVIANPNAQNADTNLIKSLPFVLFISPPIYYQNIKAYIITTISHISEYTTELPLCNSHLYVFNKSSIYSKYILCVKKIQILVYK